jgi:hypothetical protein
MFEIRKPSLRRSNPFSPRKEKNGLLRRFAPRNDDLGCLKIKSEICATVRQLLLVC